jgi:hypothetical protein
MKTLSLIKDLTKKKRQFLIIAKRYGVNPADLQSFLIASVKHGKDTYKIWSKPLIGNLLRIVAADGIISPSEEEREFAKMSGAKVLEIKTGPVKGWPELPELFPAGIFIHKLASKRDTLDFIEKRWREIELILSRHRPNKVRIRSRKHPAIYDFIWKHRDLKTGEIKKQINAMVRGSSIPPFADYEIRNIITQEKNRRKRKINVGR